MCGPDPAAVEESPEEELPRLGVETVEPVADEPDRYHSGPFHDRLSRMLGEGVYTGMITATVGTVLLLGVVGVSLVIVRRRLRNEWWYAVHLLAYAGIALSWFHEIPTGNELVLDRAAADYWRALYVATLAILVIFRLGRPLARRQPREQDHLQQGQVRGEQARDATDVRQRIAGGARVQVAAVHPEPDDDRGVDRDR